MSEIRSARERHADLVSRVAKHETEIEALRAEVDKLEVFLQLAEELFGKDTRAQAQPEPAPEPEEVSGPPATTAPSMEQTLVLDESASAATQQRLAEMAGTKVTQKEDLVQPKPVPHPAQGADPQRIMPARQQRQV